MSRRRLLIGGKKLPYDAEIEYLESTGTQWVDTGVRVTQYPLKVESKAYFSGSEKEQDIFGNYYNLGYSQYPIIVGQYGSNFHVWTGTRWEPRSLTKYLWYVVISEALSASSLKITINGTEYTTTQTNTATNPINSSIYLFCSGNARNSPLTGRIGYVKIHINNVLVRDFIPVRVGQIGYMYDKVSGQLFGNTGTGSFTLGPDK